MSLRRSTRVQAQAVTNGIASAVVKATTPAKKRSRTTGKTEVDTKSPDTNVLNGTSTQDSDGFKVPTTPSPAKRRRPNPTTPLPPITPTPSAVGVMLTPRPSYSTGDIDDAIPSATPRPADPHGTNAPLSTPGGSRVLPAASTSTSTDTSPSTTAGIRPPPSSTNLTLLTDALAHLQRVDPTLAPLLSAHHCHVFSPSGLSEEIDPFRSLASGIMAQQVSGAAASSIKNKFIGLFPAGYLDSTHPGPPTFPAPKLVVGTPLGKLREAGLSQRKAEYIQGLAERFESGELSARILSEAGDEEVMERLVAVRGLGKWSVEMFCCFGLKRMDVFSTGDLGVQRGMAVYMGRDVGKLKNKGGKWKYMSEKEMIDIAEKFRPYRSLFMWYMWRIEDARGQGSTNVDAVQNNAS
ncbi:DNA-3-methyladenine glycosylase-like protein [Elsinoe australis]|uniref:DNA-3-methyladenine glycosylase-like protein n=1 Tax=Elsinoe australis TaxID=40998 RepID=A0A4U7AST9_9PEZI|nr:DNA-3-methyladenine glycosylase-like protein [Elsinoe australis]